MKTDDATRLSSPFVNELCRLGGAVAFRHHRGTITVAKRTLLWNNTVSLPALNLSYLGASHSAFLNLILPIIKRGTFQRCRDKIYKEFKTVWNAEEFINGNMSGSVALSLLCDTKTWNVERSALCFSTYDEISL